MKRILGVQRILCWRIADTYRLRLPPTCILLLSMVVPIDAQRIGAVRGWETAPDCMSESTTSNPGNVIESESVRDEEADFLQRFRDIEPDLPQDGRTWELAQRLLHLLDGTLRFTCKDKRTGEYVVHYPIGLGKEFVSDSEFDEFRFTLSHLSQPMIEFKVKSRPDSKEFVYTYRLYNGNSAMRPIRMWFLVAPIDDESLELDHPLWYYHSTESLMDLPAVAPQAALYWDVEGPELRRMSALGRWAQWSANGRDQEIHRGDDLGSFTAKSHLRPGWTTAFVAGGEYTTIPHREHGIPEQVRIELDGILQRDENTYSAVPVIGPMFRASSSVLEVAQNWIQGVRVLIEFGYISEESLFVVELLEILELVRTSQDPNELIVESVPSNEYEMLLDEIVVMALRRVD